MAPGGERRIYGKGTQAVNGVYRDTSCFFLSRPGAWDARVFPDVSRESVEDRQELTQRDRSNLTHPQGYLMVASPVDIS
jgi:hypothetical protein